MTRTLRARLAAPSLAVVLALGATACSADDEPARPDAGPTLSDPSEAPSFEVEPVVTTGEIVGRLAKDDRRRVVAAVSRAALRYLEAAYLDGDYPRDGGFRASLAGFAPGTARQARADLGMLTNVGLARRIDGVTPASLRVSVDALAVRGRATAATAHVKLVFRTTGRVEKRVQVQGRLMMTRTDGRWQVFAYRMSKGAR